jgi:hypothetical protein
MKRPRRRRENHQDSSYPSHESAVARKRIKRMGPVAYYLYRETPGAIRRVQDGCDAIVHDCSGLTCRGLTSNVSENFLLCFKDIFDEYSFTK